MPEFHDTQVLPFSPQQLYDVVLDIEKYSDFLPWCTRSEILEKMPEEGKLYASVSAGYALYSETYLSKVTFAKNIKIEASYLEGPFDNLHTVWRFKKHPEGCELDFSVTFHFNKSLLNVVASRMISDVTEKMVAAFVGRAHSLYKS